MTDFAIWVKYVVKADKAAEARKKLHDAGLPEAFLEHEGWPKPDVPKPKGLVHSFLSQVLGTR